MSKQIIKLAISLTLILSFSACSSFKQWQYLPTSQEDKQEVFLVSHGWHTGLVIPSQYLSDELKFLDKDFYYSKFYEFGWGDKGFYQAKEITSGLTLQAIFWPTPSVMHIVAMPVEPHEYFAHSKTLKVIISSKAMQRLNHFLAQSFKRNKEGQVIKSKKGIYGRSFFYEGQGKYFLTRTCNTWTAQALEEAGLPISSFLTLTAGSVFSQCESALEKQPKYQ